MIADLINTGNPIIDARYVALIRCEASQAGDWVEPVIMAWAGGKWHTTFIPRRKVLGWIGPLPVLKVDDMPHDIGIPIVEYDL